MVFHNHTAGESATGEEVRGHLESIFETWPDIRFETRRLYVRDGLVVQEWTATATHTQHDAARRHRGASRPAREVSWDGMDVIPFEDGLVKRKDVYSDSVSILRQVGLLLSGHPAGTGDSGVPPHRRFRLRNLWLNEESGTADIDLPMTLSVESGKEFIRDEDGRAMGAVDQHFCIPLLGSPSGVGVSVLLRQARRLRGLRPACRSCAHQTHFPRRHRDDLPERLLRSGCRYPRRGRERARLRPSGPQGRAPRQPRC